MGGGLRKVHSAGVCLLLVERRGAVGLPLVTAGLFSKDEIGWRDGERPYQSWWQVWSARS